MNNKKPATIMKHYRQNVHYKDAMLDVVKTEIQKEIRSLVNIYKHVLLNYNMSKPVYNWNCCTVWVSLKVDIDESFFLALSHENEEFATIKRDCGWFNGNLETCILNKLASTDG